MWKELKKKLVELTHHRGWIYGRTKLGENKGFISLIINDLINSRKNINRYFQLHYCTLWAL